MILPRTLNEVCVTMQQGEIKKCRLQIDPGTDIFHKGALYLSPSNNNIYFLSNNSALWGSIPPEGIPDDSYAYSWQIAEVNYVGPLLCQITDVNLNPESGISHGENMTGKVVEILIDNPDGTNLPKGYRTVVKDGLGYGLMLEEGYCIFREHLKDVTKISWKPPVCGEYLFCHTDLKMNSGYTAAYANHIYVCRNDFTFRNEIDSDHHIIDGWQWFRKATPTEIARYKREQMEQQERLKQMQEMEKVKQATVTATDITAEPVSQDACGAVDKEPDPPKSMFMKPVTLSASTEENSLTQVRHHKPIVVNKESA